MRLPAFLLLIFLLPTSVLVAQQAPATAGTGTTKIKQKARKVKPPKKAARQQAAPVIVFRKTPCYGTCPDYDATIYADGRVTYVGRQFVKLTGTHELKLSAATLAKIQADAQALGFGKLDAHYTKNSTDLPSTFFSIRQPDGTLKTVQVEEGEPAALKVLIDYVSAELDKIAGNNAKK